MPRFWAIDFGDALVGHIDDFEARGLDAPSQDKVRSTHARGLPIAALTPGVDVAARRASAISFVVVRAITEAAGSVALEPDDRRLARALHLRCREAPAIVRCYMERLRVLS